MQAEWGPGRGAHSRRLLGISEETEAASVERVCPGEACWNSSRSCLSCLYVTLFLGFQLFGGRFWAPAVFWALLAGFGGWVFLPNVCGWRVRTGRPACRSHPFGAHF